MRLLPALLLFAVSLVLIHPAAADAKGKKAAPAKAVKTGGPPNVKLKPAEDPPPDAAAPSSGPVSSRGPTRLDFDDRLIQGQTNKSGAVYLYDRKELKTRSMIKKRDSFRDEIVSSIYD